MIFSMKWMDFIMHPSIDEMGDGFHPREERDERVSRNGKVVVVVVGSLARSVGRRPVVIARRDPRTR